MNDRLENIMAELKPIVSIVVYRTENPVSGQGEYYLESHTINEQGQVMEGKPLQQETIEQMVGVFFDEKKNSAVIKGMIPDNLLSFKLLPGGRYQMAWYRPAEQRVIHHAAQLKIPTAKVWVPALLYVINGHSLDVYALKANTRPKESTQLYKAPFFNTSDNGVVCLGNAMVKKPKQLTYESIMKYWEDLFWLSEFSHVNGDEKVRCKDLASVWRTLIKSKSKTKWSDINELLPYKTKTLKHIL